MRYSLITAVAALTALSGCMMSVTSPVPVATAPGQAVPGLSLAALAAARGVINTEMAKRLPGVNTQPYTDCVMSNSTPAELYDLAAIAAGGTGIATDVVANVIRRPVATQCIARVGAMALYE